MDKKALTETLKIYECELQNLVETLKENRENVNENPNIIDALLKSLKTTHAQLNFLIKVLSERKVKQRHE